MLGVVIVSYRSDDLTVRFVKEELTKITVPYRVVVVANGYDAARAQQLAERIPEAVVLPAENRGFAAGNNLGVRYLVEHYDPEYILLTNNDIQFRSDHLVESLCKTLRAHPESAAVGPEVVGRDGRRQGPEPYLGLWTRFFWMYVGTPFLSPAKKRRLFALDYPEQAEVGPQYKLTGCFLVIDPKVFLQVGGFDEGTFLYAEENILSDRLASVGKCFYFDPSVIVLHAHGQTIERSYDARRRALLQYDSMGYYYRHYRGYSSLSVRLVRLFQQLVLRMR